jgi:hypothetical protein
MPQDTLRADRTAAGEYLAAYALRGSRSSGAAAVLPRLRHEPHCAVLSPSATESAFVDVAPLASRLVVFTSERVLHEVRPAFDTERFALTVWMK